MKYVGLYHLNAYTYGDPTWFPDMDPELRAFFNKVTKGSLSGKAGEKPVEDGHLLADLNGPRYQAFAEDSTAMPVGSPMHNPIGRLRLVSMRDIAETN